MPVQVITSPSREIAQETSVFLAGSIDMGRAEDWQTRLIGALADLPVTLFNPRRDDWDASWEQDISNDQFREQVEWELDHLDAADIVFVYFDPNGQAPISLLELGLHAPRDRCIVCCPPGFWRRGNVQIVCARYGVSLFDDLDAAIAELRQAVSRLKC